jgi:hypothetical protein
MVRGIIKQNNNMNKTEQLQLVQRILHEEVGYIKTPKYKGGDKFSEQIKVPKLHGTITGFVAHLKSLKENGSKKYRELDIDYILHFCKQGKQKKIATTTLKQDNLNGKTDTIKVIGRTKEKVIYAK